MEWYNFAGLQNKTCFRYVCFDSENDNRTGVVSATSKIYFSMFSLLHRIYLCAKLSGFRGSHFRIADFHSLFAEYSLDQFIKIVRIFSHSVLWFEFLSSVYSHSGRFYAFAKSPHQIYFQPRIIFGQSIKRFGYVKLKCVVYRVCFLADR